MFGDALLRGVPFYPLEQPARGGTTEPPRLVLHVVVHRARQLLSQPMGMFAPKLFVELSLAGNRPGDGNGAGGVVRTSLGRSGSGGGVEWHEQFAFDLVGGGWESARGLELRLDVYRSSFGRSRLLGSLAVDVSAAADIGQSSRPQWHRVGTAGAGQVQLRLRLDRATSCDRRHRCCGPGWLNSLAA